MTHSRRSGRRTRTNQRRLHLLAAVPVIAYVYLAPELDPAVTSATRWVMTPALALSGIAMWQWPRFRKLRGRWSSDAGAGSRATGIGSGAR